MTIDLFLSPSVTSNLSPCPLSFSSWAHVESALWDLCSSSPPLGTSWPLFCSCRGASGLLPVCTLLLSSLLPPPHNTEEKTLKHNCHHSYPLGEYRTLPWFPVALGRKLKHNRPVPCQLLSSTPGPSLPCHPTAAHLQPPPQPHEASHAPVHTSLNLAVVVLWALILLHLASPVPLDLCPLLPVSSPPQESLWGLACQTTTTARTALWNIQEMARLGVFAQLI